MLFSLIHLYHGRLTFPSIHINHGITFNIYFKIENIYHILFVDNFRLLYMVTS